MTHHHRIDSIAKSVPQARRLRGRIVCPGDEALLAAPQRDQASRIGVYFLPCHAARAFLRAQVARGDQPAQVPVAPPVLGEEHNIRRVFERQLSADDETDAQFATRQVRSRRTIQAIAV